MTKHQLLYSLAPDLAKVILAGEPRKPASREQQIYANRHLRMDSIHTIGFDMDYTLANYRQESIEQLIFHLTQERLVAERAYPQDILKLSYQGKRILRGLVVDKKLGNMLKLDAHHHVCRVSHGLQKLDAEQRQQLYRSRRVSLSGRRYLSLDTQFSMPEVALFGALVDYFDQCKTSGLSLQPVAEQNGKVSYEKIFADVHASINYLHDRGELKTQILENLHHFIERDPLLAASLNKLRLADKRLFLLTNSGWKYTNKVMQYLLEGAHDEAARWQDYFHVIVVDAGKPRFFTKHESFLILDDKGRAQGTVSSGQFEQGQVYARGNIRDFERLAKAFGDSVLYVGDHIYGDILRSKKDSMWRTALITQEIEREVSQLDAVKKDLDKLAALDKQRSQVDVANNELQSLVPKIEATLRRARHNKRPRLSAIELRRLDDLLTSIQAEIDSHKGQLRQLGEQSESLLASIEAAFNPMWGRVFKEGYELSRYGAQVENYACIYTSRVTNFIYYSALHDFRARLDLMAHEVKSSSSSSSSPQDEDI